MPWKSDSYSPLDFTLLDHHFGKLAEWRAAIDEIHKRGMYILMDNTFSTLVLRPVCSPRNFADSQF
jgi:alpha-1,3-glucan synthase